MKERISKQIKSLHLQCVGMFPILDIPFYSWIDLNGILAIQKNGRNSGRNFWRKCIYMDVITQQIESYLIEKAPKGNISQATAEVLRQIFSNVNYPTKGLQRMAIESLDVSAIDDSHYMVFVKWKSTSLKDKSVNNLSITYFLRKKENGFEVVSALTNNDLLHLRENGYIE